MRLEIDTSTWETKEGVTKQLEKSGYIGALGCILAIVMGVFKYIY